MLNPIEKFKVAFLHLNIAWNHCIRKMGTYVLGSRRNDDYSYMNVFTGPIDSYIVLGR